MTLELSRQQPEIRIDPNLQTTIIVSLLGLTLTLALLWLGNDFGTWLAMAG